MEQAQTAMDPLVAAKDLVAEAKTRATKAAAAKDKAAVNARAKIKAKGIKILVIPATQTTPKSSKRAVVKPPFYFDIV